MNKKVIKLTENYLHNIIKESVKNVLKESRKYIPDATYIVCDGTSCYGVLGCDVEDEIQFNDAEVVKGPFRNWDDNVDDLITKLNDDMYGTHMYR